MKKYNQLLENKFVKKNADIHCLVGEYIVIGNPNIKSFELKQENIVKIKEEKGHILGCCKKNEDEYVYGINLFSGDFILGILPFFPINEPIYTFILHKNGVIRFRINDNIPQIYKLLLAYVDSTGFIDTINNLIHVLKNGCFCFGLLTEDNNIVRYNRWNDDCELFAEYIKIHD
jgi:hypothetical protein